MSGVECVGAILGIAGVGIQVAATLYDYASTTSTAKDDMNMIAESIDTYSSVLETLGRQLESSGAVCSMEGVKLAQDLQRQSDVLFKKIAENIPSSKGEGTSTRQKMSWFFQRDRVNFLLGQIEQLKATVSLLVQILILAQTSKPATRTETNHTTTHNVTNNVNINVNVVNAELNSQFRRAENRVMQYHNASVKLANLQIEDDQPVVRNALPWQEEFEPLPVVRQTERDDDDIAATFGQLALRTPRMTSADTNANSAQLVSILLDHWTTVESHESTTSFMAEESPGSQTPGFSSSSAENQDSKTTDEILSRSETAPDVDAPKYTATSTVKVTSTGMGNPVKGWWQKYRQSAKTKSEEEERQRQLQKQEDELKRRETHLQREQTLLDRELKLQEAERQKEEAKAKALAERERRAAESQKLSEAAHKQALAEKELKAQTEQAKKEARKEHLARLKDIRSQTRGVSRKESYKDGSKSSITDADDNDSRDAENDFKPPSRISTTATTISTSPSLDSSGPPPSYSQQQPPSSSPSSPPRLPSPPQLVSNILQNGPGSALSLLASPHAQSHPLSNHLSQSLSRLNLHTTHSRTRSSSTPQQTAEGITNSIDGESMDSDPNSSTSSQWNPLSNVLEHKHLSLHQKKAQLRRQKREAREARKAAK